MGQNSTVLATLSGVLCTLGLEESAHTGRTHAGSSREPTAVQRTAGTQSLSEFLIIREHKLFPLEVPE